MPDALLTPPEAARMLAAIVLRRLGGPGSGNFGHAGRPGEVGGSGPGGATVDQLDPKKKDTWYRNGGTWNRSVDGEQPYGWRQHRLNYEPPAVQHKTLRGPYFAAWGGSHSGSKTISGDAARQMGLEGWENRNASPELSDLATRMLTEIANDTVGSEEPLYHAFENVKGTVFMPGDTLRLPPVASSGRPHTVYGTRMEHENQQGPPIVLMFPKGTPMVGYSITREKDLEDLGQSSVEAQFKEQGYLWDEAIVAGEFEVDRVETEYFGSQHSEKPIGPNEPIPQIYGQVVYLKPKQIYDPATQRWRKPRG